MSDRHYIISSFPKLETAHWKTLLSHLNSYNIYHQGNKDMLPKNIAFKNITYTKRSGHNISDYLFFIIKNYPFFPKEIGFIKSNVFPRHIDLLTFKKRIKNEAFIPLYSEKSTFNVKKNFFGNFIFQQVAPGICLEISNNWYIKNRPVGKYYPKLENLYKAIVRNGVFPKYIPMVPGANMIIKSVKILDRSKSFYEDLYNSCTYQDPPSPMPVEAWHLERMMLYLFHFQKF